MTVKQQQLLLMYLGYDPGELDGIPGPNTNLSKNYSKVRQNYDNCRS